MISHKTNRDNGLRQDGEFHPGRYGFCDLGGNRCGRGTSVAVAATLLKRLIRTIWIARRLTSSGNLGQAPVSILHLPAAPERFDALDCRRAGARGFHGGVVLYNRRWRWR